MPRRERWRRQGVLVDPGGAPPWAASHAALPFARPTGPAGAELYFSPRDARGRAHVARTPVELEDGALTAAPGPPELVLGPGELGAFDDNGTTNSAVVDHDGRRFLFYTGWTLGRTVPFHFFIGLAVSDDGGATFRRASRAPVLGRTDVDPFLTASPSVVVEGGTWRMWYVSCLAWEEGPAGPRHRYHVRYAESADGVQWRPTGHVAIDFASDEEYAIARPHVLREDGRYRMWFSARGAAYRLGYAESDDGLTWERDDAAAGLDVSSTGWDSEMLAYPAILDVGGRRFLLYNGNGYGATGLGVAVDEGP